MQQLIESFKGKRVLIIGDVMIDAYIFGKVNRISPEAPVPIVNLNEQDARLGGAANVGLNVKSLGAIPILCSVVGNDTEGKRFKNIIGEANMPTNGLVFSDNRVTTVKTRIIGNNQQLLRIDAENTHFLSSSEEIQLIEKISTILEQEIIDVVILEDYNKGVLTEKVIEHSIAIANEKGIPIAVDPKLKNFFAYKGVTMFKPNMKELAEGLKREVKFTKREAFDQSVTDLESQLQNVISFVTLSEHGVYIKKGSEIHHIPAFIRNIADVSGAGDTVISVASLCLAVGADIKTLAYLSNLAGGLVCEKVGVVSITPEELIEELKLQK